MTHPISSFDTMNLSFHWGIKLPVDKCNKVWETCLRLLQSGAWAGSWASSNADASLMATIKDNHSVTYELSDLAHNKCWQDTTSTAILGVFSCRMFQLKLSIKAPPKRNSSKLVRREFHTHWMASQTYNHKYHNKHGIRKSRDMSLESKDYRNDKECQTNYLTRVLCKC